MGVGKPPETVTSGKRSLFGIIRIVFLGESDAWLLDHADEIAQSDSKRRGNTTAVHDRYIFFPALDNTYIGTTKPRSFGKLLLR